MNDLLLLLGVAFALDLLIGDPHSPLHPVALFGNYAAKVEAFARRRFGSTVRAGFLGWCLAALPPALFAAGSILLVRRGFGPHAAAVAAGVWLYMTIALRSLVQHAEAVRRPLAADDLVSARRALSMIVSRDTAGLDRSEPGRADGVLVDCLTLWINNLLYRNPEFSEQGMRETLAELLPRMRCFPGPAVLVLNEVGLGLVPETPLGRRFRDLSGRCGQLVAAEADELYFVVCGIPQRIK